MKGTITRQQAAADRNQSGALLTSGLFVSPARRDTVRNQTGNHLPDDLLNLHPSKLLAH